MTTSRTPRPPAPVVVLLALAALAAVVLSLAIGSRPIGLGDVWGALVGQVQGAEATVVTTQRLPRTLLGVVVGAALGMAGALMQGHTRNPLADPGLFGVNAGTSFAVALVTFTVGVSSPGLQVIAALTGAASVTPSSSSSPAVGSAEATWCSSRSWAPPSPPC